ncbi:MAG TPA: cytochrome c [Pyrinomonadaceae bacterium]|nr:cytochrome c [Pyrinomonadaceae bacterium]
MLRNKVLAIAVLSLVALAAGCRYDMQDQPRLKYYKESDFFADKRGSRDQVENTIARGHLFDNKAFYTGKIDNPNMSAPVQTTTDASGNTLVTSFPNDVDEFPVPVTKELIDRGEERFNVYCIVCHGPLGNGDGMVVRRGFPKPPTYHDDRLRNAPVGHFFDVITNGWGRMPSYSYQISPADRWAIVSYIRALQATQNPDQNQKMTAPNGTNSNTTVPHTGPVSANTNTNGGRR